ncbi:MAG: hypothetical protein OXU81_10500 [Gammaproteobacteria bacterium]|nr:hypothetical protein [Gammaproteobacteria bacterium]
MLAIRLPADIEERLDRLAKATGRTKEILSEGEAQGPQFCGKSLGCHRCADVRREDQADI